MYAKLFGAERWPGLQLTCYPGWCITLTRGTAHTNKHTYYKQVPIYRGPDLYGLLDPLPRLAAKGVSHAVEALRQQLLLAVVEMPGLTELRPTVVMQVGG